MRYLTLLFVATWVAVALAAPMAGNADKVVAEGTEALTEGMSHLGLGQPSPLHAIPPSPRYELPNGMAFQPHGPVDSPPPHLLSPGAEHPVKPSSSTPPLTLPPRRPARTTSLQPPNDRLRVVVGKIVKPSAQGGGMRKKLQRTTSMNSKQWEEFFAQHNIDRSDPLWGFGQESGH